MTLNRAFLTPEALAPVLQATNAGREELRRGVTELPAPALELLVRLDGVSPLSEARGAMASLDDVDFMAALGHLRQLGLVEDAPADPFTLAAREQLRKLGGEKATGGGLRQAGFSVGLVRRRPARARGGDGAPVAVLVEDDPMLARFIQSFLGLEGFEVKTAADRSQIQQVMREQPVPALVLLDVTLPDIDGFQVLRALRQHPTFGGVPVVMLTGRATREAVLAALAGGADGYLTKPVDAETLVAAVRAVTGLGEAPKDGLTLGPWTNPDAGSGRRGEG